MKSIIMIFMAGMLLTTGCVKDNLCIHGKGEIKEIPLTIGDFNSVDLRGSMNVVIMSGDKQEIIAKGHENIINQLRTEVVNGTWAVNLQQGCYNFFELTVYITIPDLKKVTLNGSGDIDIKNYENHGNLSIESRASGAITLQSVKGSEVVDVKISGSGPVEFLQAFPDLKNLTVDISGSGAFKGFPAMTNNCTVKISGSGNCEVSVENQLDVTIMGSGNVYYKGRPVINVNDTGSGSLISRN